MKAKQYVTDTTMTALVCVACGVRFGIDSSYVQILEEHSGGCQDDDDEGGWFFCPNGHRQQFVASPAKALGEQLAQYKHKLEQAEARVYQLQRSVINRKIGRSLKRTKAGKRKSGKN